MFVFYAKRRWMEKWDLDLHVVYYEPSSLICISALVALSSEHISETFTCITTCDCGAIHTPNTARRRSYFEFSAWNSRCGQLIDGFTHDVQSPNRREDEFGYQLVKRMLSDYSCRDCGMCPLEQLPRYAASISLPKN